MKQIVAPIPGLVARVYVALGQRVGAGETVVALNVMKTEVTVASDVQGIVREIRVKEWDEVDIGTVLVVVDDQ